MMTEEEYQLEEQVEIKKLKAEKMELKDEIKRLTDELIHAKATILRAAIKYFNEVDRVN